MKEATITEITADEDRIFLRFKDSKVDLVHLDPQHLGEDYLAQFVNNIRASLTAGLTQHAQEQMRRFEADFQASLEPDAARDQALEQAYHHVAEAEATVQPVDRWRFLNQTDGRDESNRIHVSVDGNEIVILEIPLEMFHTLSQVALGIKDALNQALERQDRDLIRSLERIEARGNDIVYPDWKDMI